MPDTAIPRDEDSLDTLMALVDSLTLRGSTLVALGLMDEGKTRLACAVLRHAMAKDQLRRAQRAHAVACKGGGAA